MKNEYKTSKFWTKVRKTWKKIGELGKGDIFSAVTCFMCLGVIVSATFFVAALNDGVFEVGLIVSIFAYLVFMCAWINVKGKFETSSELLEKIYGELKKRSDEEKTE